MTNSSQEGVYSSTPPSFVIGRYIEGICINGLEFLLNDNDELMQFPSIDDAKQFLAIAYNCEPSDPILEENFNYLPYEKTQKQTDHPQG